MPGGLVGFQLAGTRDAITKVPITELPDGASSGNHVARMRTRRSRNKIDVVLAKARTHYPKSQSLRDAGAAIPFITERGGYGSWLSPG
jgi:hypothetical protein